MTKPKKSFKKDGAEAVLEISADVKTDRYKQDTKLRSELVHWLKWLINVYLLAIFVILLFNHICIFIISDVVLTTLLGTTTLNILGLMYIVLKGLFDNQKK